MKKIFFLFLLVVLFPVASGAQETKTQRSVLKNGLTLVSSEQSGDLTSACLFIRVSPKDEPAGRKGLTNIVNRMLLSCDPLGKGASSVLKIEQFGGFVFLDTQEDYYSFTLSVPSKNFTQAIKAFSEMFIKPDFSESALSREKEGVAASWLRDSDIIEEKVCRELLYKWRGGNSLPNTGNVTIDMVKAWYSKYYGPSNMVLSICGPNSDGSLKSAGEAFGRYLPPASSASAITGGAEAAEKSAAGKDKREAIVFGYTMPAAGSADYPAMLVAKAMIASGTGSGMFVGFRGQDVVSYLFGSRLESSNPELRLVLFAVPEAGKSVEAGRKLLFAVNSVKNDTVSQQDFERAKEFARGELLMCESTHDIARSTGFYEMAGLGPNYGEKLQRLVEKSGRQETARAAAKYLAGGFAFNLPANESASADSDAR